MKRLGFFRCRALAGSPGADVQYRWRDASAATVSCPSGARGGLPAGWRCGPRAARRPHCALRSPTRTTAMRLFHKFVLLTLSMLFAACSTPVPRAAPSAPPQVLFKGTDVSETDVIARSKQEGCQLIPYDTRRSTCVDENAGLHEPTACDALACQKAAGNAANRLRLAAWQSCVDRRTLINGAFDSTLKDLDAFKRGPSYKNWNQPGKNAMATLITKIKAGQPGHATALKNATSTLKDCKKIVN
ncbi:hypothetical protein EIQ04_09050 [Xanthomonas campestris pv. raphani]